MNQIFGCICTLFTPKRPGGLSPHGKTGTNFLHFLPDIFMRNHDVCCGMGVRDGETIFFFLFSSRLHLLFSISIVHSTDYSIEIICSTAPYVRERVSWTHLGAPWYTAISNIWRRVKCLVVCGMCELVKANLERSRLFGILMKEASRNFALPEVKSFCRRQWMCLCWCLSAGKLEKTVDVCSYSTVRMMWMCEKNIENLSPVASASHRESTRRERLSVCVLHVCGHVCRLWLVRCEKKKKREKLSSCELL